MNFNKFISKLPLSVIRRAFEIFFENPFDRREYFIVLKIAVDRNG